MICQINQAYLGREVFNSLDENSKRCKEEISRGIVRDVVRRNLSTERCSLDENGLPCISIFGLTGGPSVGKSKIIRALQLKGEVVCEEAAASLKSERMANGIEAPWEQKNFEVDIFDLKIAREEEGRKQAQLSDKVRCFCDRTFWDSLVYIEHCNKLGSEEHLYIEEKLAEFRAKERYTAIFLIEHWNGSYISEESGFRQESTEEAMVLDEKIRRLYASNGISLVMVPRGTPEERANYILDKVKEIGGGDFISAATR